MPWGALAAGIAATAATANTYYSGVQAENLNRENRAWQEAMVGLQRQWALEDWERENDVGAWRQRVANAGFNPPLLAGQSDLSSPSSSVRGGSSYPNPNVHMPQFDSSGFVQAAQMLMQDKLVSAQSRNANAQSVSSIMDAAIEAYKVGGKSAFNMVIDKFANFLSGSNPDDGLIAKEMKSRLYNIDMDSLNKELAYNLSKKYSPQQIQTGIMKTEQEVSKIVAELNSMRIQNDYVIQKKANEIVLAAAQAFNLYKQGQKAAADAATINAVRDYTVSLIRSNANIQENESYISSVYREGFESAAGYLTSKEGKENLAKKLAMDSRYNADPLIYVVNKEFSKLLGVGKQAVDLGFKSSFIFK